LSEEGGLPDVSDLPRRPSGRVEREAADAYFAKREAELAQAPQDWRAWYRVAHAYDIAGDRRRARDAMKRAVALEAEERNASAGRASPRSWRRSRQRSWCPRSTGPLRRSCRLPCPGRPAARAACRR